MGKPLYRNRRFLASGLGALLIFALFMVYRLDQVPEPDGIRAGAAWTGAIRTEQERWMGIFQDGVRIGYAHHHITPGNGQYRVDDRMVLKLNTMGVTQMVEAVSSSITDLDFSLKRFSFTMTSGRLSFTVTGAVVDRQLNIRTLSPGGEDTELAIPLETPPCLSSGVIHAAMASGLGTGDEMVIQVFDPATLGQAPATLKVMGKEILQLADRSIEVHPIRFSFKGMVQTAWVTPRGEVIKEEGLLGITLVKMDRESAMADLPAGPARDLTRMVSVASNERFADPQALQEMTVSLFVPDSGTDHQIPAAGCRSQRQTWVNGQVTIVRETLYGLSRTLTDRLLEMVDSRFLEPDPLVQSGHPRIRNLAGSLVEASQSPLEKVKKMMEWIRENIRRRPVISLPNALSTLEARAGDCNEHAALMAALCRAAGIPAAIDTGLVYLDGAFYYHAWNRVYLGQWVTVDALFGQIPADVTHICLASGASDAPLDLLGVLGRIRLEVMDWR